ncbi:MAG TPA: FHA domain-containing protein [Patescibacteria group bacterium]|nr:FHA domain-containing protein [Patescibacteria group bacterium]
MKKRSFSEPATAGRGQCPLQQSFSARFAGFSFLGFWQANKTQLLLAAVAVVVIVVFVLWIFRRRRQEVFPEIRSQAAAEDVVLDLGLTQVEPQPAVESRPAPSPGIHGKIEVVVGNQQISTYLVTDNPLSIGRDPAQSLVIIQEAIVSKLHCQIFARSGKVFVKDLNSTNGVYLNEEKIAERELNDNDVVFLGKKGSVKIIYHR